MDKVQQYMSTAYQYFGIPQQSNINITPVTHNTNPYQPPPATTNISNPSPRHYPQPHPMLPGLNNNSLPQQYHHPNNNNSNQPAPQKRISYMSRDQARQNPSFSLQHQPKYNPLNSFQPHLPQHQHQHQHPIHHHPTPQLQTIESNPMSNQTHQQQQHQQNPQQQPPIKRKSNLSQALPPPSYHKSSPRENTTDSPNNDHVNNTKIAKERSSHQHKISNQEPINQFQLDNMKQKERAKLQFSASASNHVAAQQQQQNGNENESQQQPPRSLHNIYSNGTFAHSPFKRQSSTKYATAMSVASSRNGSFRVKNDEKKGDNDDEDGHMEDDEDMDLQPTPPRNASHGKQLTEMTEMTELTELNDLNDNESNINIDHHTTNDSMNSIPVQHIQSLSSELKTFKAGQQANNISVNPVHRSKTMPKSSLALMNSGLLNAQGNLSLVLSARINKHFFFFIKISCINIHQYIIFPPYSIYFYFARDFAIFPCI